MKKVLIVTSTRADFGLLNSVIRKFEKDEEIDCQVAATGSHLSKEFGYTIREVEDNCDCKVHRISILEGTTAKQDVCQAMANAITRFGNLFQSIQPDVLLVLGDRYEIFAIAAAATNYLIPIIHMYGGETTEGAVDEAFRHSITKMSYLHFTATEDYRRRVIQLGEAPERVFCVGSTGVENIHNQHLIDKEELERSLGFPLGNRYAVGTFHPETLYGGSAATQVEAVIEACRSYPEITFLFTKANADTGGETVNRLMQSAADTTGNLYLVDSLGYIRYLSALKQAEFVIGNSSSGIVETPSFRIPTINIGNRQKGRTQAKSIINCEPTKESICDAIDKAIHMDCSDVTNPFEGKNPSGDVVRITKEFLLKGIRLQKSFYDIRG